MKRFLGLVALVLSGCATVPSQADYGPQSYGSEITKEDAQARAKEWLDHNLKDPDSARLEWGALSQHCVRDGLILGGAVHCGYELTSLVNSKNSYGGYTGNIPTNFLFCNQSLCLVIQNENEAGSYGGVTTGNVVFRSF